MFETPSTNPDGFARNSVGVSSLCIQTSANPGKDFHTVLWRVILDYRLESVSNPRLGRVTSYSLYSVGQSMSLEFNSRITGIMRVRDPNYLQ